MDLRVEADLQLDLTLPEGRTGRLVIGNTADGGLCVSSEGALPRIGIVRCWQGYKRLRQHVAATGQGLALSRHGQHLITFRRDRAGRVTTDISWWRAGLTLSRLRRGRA
jgi:hypothetical protein